MCYRVSLLLNTTWNFACSIIYTKSLVLRIEKMINGQAMAEDAEQFPTNQTISVLCSQHVKVCFGQDTDPQIAPHGSSIGLWMVIAPNEQVSLCMVACVRKCVWMGECWLVL